MQFVEKYSVFWLSKQELGVMKRSRRIALIALVSLIGAFVAVVSWTRVQNPELVASTDSYRPWIALLKGFEGDVEYIGSDDSHAYFRVGWIFWSYYKVPSCATQLPETFPVRGGKPYAVKFHINSDNTIRAEGRCARNVGYALGNLDRKYSQ